MEERENTSFEPTLVASTQDTYNGTIAETIEREALDDGALAKDNESSHAQNSSNHFKCVQWYGLLTKEAVQSH